MLWRSPNLLWLLPLVALLLAAVVLRLRRGAAALGGFAEPGLAARLAPDVLYARRHWRAVLRAAALALAVLALAGPRWGFHWEQVRREGIDLIVAIDVSRSMLATDVKPNRLERAKLAVEDLVGFLRGDRIGLVAFAGAAFLECPLTLDYGAFTQSLRSLDVGIIPRGGTALARAVEVSLEAFEARQGRYEALILITDGEDHDGKVEEAAKLAAERGVKIYTVGIGTTEGEIIPIAAKSGASFVKDRQGQVVKSRLNEEALQQIAATSGGAYVRGLGTALGLDEVFRDHIAKMERREVASSLERRYEDRFQIPLAAALALLVVESLIRERRTPRKRRGAAAASLAVVLLAAAPAAAWFDPPRDRAAEGNRLFEQKKYAEASARYQEGLVDSPASPLLQYNLGVSLYKEGKFEDAAAYFSKVLASGLADYVPSAAYNLGRAQLARAGELEAGDKQKALASYDQALASFKRAMGADPRDLDPKRAHEVAHTRRAELLKKIEEEKQKQQEQAEQQEQQPEQQPEGEQPEQEQAGDEQQEEQQEQPQEQQPQEQAGDPSGEQEQPPQEQEQQQQAGQGEEEQQPPAPEQEQAAQAGGGRDQPQQGEEAQASGGEGEPAEIAEEQASPDQQAAQAVLDTARSEELEPEDLRRKVKVAGELPVAQDW